MIRPDARLQPYDRHVGRYDTRLAKGLATSADYEDFDDLWFSFEQGVGGSGSLYLSLDTERRAALRAGVYERLGSPPGHFRLDAHAWWVYGVA